MPPTIGRCRGCGRRCPGGVPRLVGESRKPQTPIHGCRLVAPGRLACLPQRKASQNRAAQLTNSEPPNRGNNRLMTTRSATIQFKMCSTRKWSDYQINTGCRSCYFTSRAGPSKRLVHSRGQGIDSRDSIESRTRDSATANGAARNRRRHGDERRRLERSGAVLPFPRRGFRRWHSRHRRLQRA